MNSAKKDGLFFLIFLLIVGGLSYGQYFYINEMKGLKTEIRELKNRSMKLDQQAREQIARKCPGRIAGVADPQDDVAVFQDRKMAVLFQHQYEGPGGVFRDLVFRFVRGSSAEFDRPESVGFVCGGCSLRQNGSFDKLNIHG